MTLASWTGMEGFALTRTSPQANLAVTGSAADEYVEVRGP